MKVLQFISKPPKGTAQTVFIRFYPLTDRRRSDTIVSILVAISAEVCGLP